AAHHLPTPGERPRLSAQLSAPELARLPVLGYRARSELVSRWCDPASEVGHKKTAAPKDRRSKEGEAVVTRPYDAESGRALQDRCRAPPACLAQARQRVVP